MPVAPIFGRANSLPEQPFDTAHHLGNERRFWGIPRIQLWLDPLIVGRFASISWLGYFDCLYRFDDPCFYGII